MPDLDLLWTDATLVGISGAVASPWVNVRGQEDLRISRNQAGGTYQFEIDWSRDGVTVDFTEVVNTVEDDQVSQPVGAEWARFRVRNTNTTVAFTAHRTNVYAWGWQN